jgi:hypothetical protein
LSKKISTGLTREIAFGFLLFKWQEGITIQVCSSTAKIYRRGKREDNIGPSHRHDGLQSSFWLLMFFESAEKKSQGFFAKTVQTATV